MPDKITLVKYTGTIPADSVVDTNPDDTENTDPGSGSGSDTTDPGSDSGSGSDSEGGGIYE